MDDFTALLVILGGAYLLLMLLFSTGLSFFVGLKSPPAKRAGWTVGFSALLTALIFAWIESSLGEQPTAPLPEGLIWAAPALIVAETLLVFLYWYWSFRRSWLDDAEVLAADGVGIEDDDWRIGLFRLVMLLAFAIVIMLFRALTRTGAL